VEITLVRVEITVVSVITFVRVKITLRLEITLCVFLGLIESSEILRIKEQKLTNILKILTINFLAL
jgi:hypothetical protein